MSTFRRVVMEKYVRKGSTGNYLTRLLFYEVHIKVAKEARTHPAIFTLEEDVEGLVNARRTFVEMGDTTGFKWTMKYLEGDLNHWDALMRCEWFRDAYKNWCREIELRRKVASMEKIEEIAQGSGPQSYHAAKFLVKEEHKQKTRGRPTKEEVKGSLKRAMEHVTEEDSDYLRMTQTEGSA